LQTEGRGVEDLVRAKRVGLLTETWEFIKHNKKWWLLPVVLVLLTLGVLVFLAGSGAGPLIYTLF
jgi:hypothetical protein